MTEPLSFAAQAVLDAAFSAYWSAEQEAPNDEGMIAAAALRAAADQVVPLHICGTNATRAQTRLGIRHKLLAIAAELEAER
jgi:sulfur relay (sulfurtransferase) complex TusBCD TusD component (DsrE family)